ncbi:MAG: GNAT family N-acetyltransferase [Anaerolineales bacterium]
MRMLDEIVNYEHVVTLEDGAQVLLRPMVTGDRDALVAMFAATPEEDVSVLYHDVRDPAVVTRWCDTLDYARVLPMIALADLRAVGQASLHFGRGPQRHTAKVRVYVAPEFRRRGLGTQLLGALVDVARRLELQILVAEVLSEQTSVIRAFMGVGFDLCCAHDDYFMLPNGETRDVSTLALRLHAHELVL